MEQSALLIFQSFKALHPHSKESFVDSPENVKRWKWHIKEAARRVPGEVYEADADAVAAMDRIRSQRWVKHFSDMPSDVQYNFQIIASHFPGSMVAACGSRVRGDYVDEWMPDSFRELRRRIGMAWKLSSDYDFVAYTIRDPIGELPVWADRVRHVPVNEQIFIPMWDFSKLPESEYAKVKELVAVNNWRALVAIHDQYKLSENVYCCDLDPVKRWYIYAIENGMI